MRISSEDFSLQQNSYLLFEGGFSEPFNFRSLLVGFALYRSQNKPGIELGIETEPLYLVCLHPKDAQQDLFEAYVHGMGLVKYVIFIRKKLFLNVKPFYQNARAVISTALQDPRRKTLRNAIRYQKALLCSEMDDFLVEIQNGALGFDPRKPQAIADAINRVLGQTRAGKEK